MPIPKNGVTIYDKDGNIHNIAELVDNLKADKERVLIDDDIGISIDISDLEYYVYSFDLTEQKITRAKISTLHHRKKKIKILRITLSSGTAVDVSEDTIFHVKDKNGDIKYVRADNLKEGMDVMSGITPNGPGVVIY